MSGNGRLANQYRLVEQQIRLFIISTYQSIPDINVAIAHHSPIVDAILSGKRGTAARLSEHHVMREGERVLRMVKFDAE